MIRRRQLPVSSPLTVRALASGAAAALGIAHQPERRVLAVLRELYDPREILLTDSGTSALRLALRGAFEAQEGPIAMPAYSCYDIATAAVGAGVPVLLYDVDPATLGPDFSSLEAALAAGATAVVVVHLYGIPVALDEVRRLARAHGALVIEDAAQGAGAAYNDRPLGAIGSLGVLSFGRGKGTTGGAGGALLANDADGSRILGSVASLLPERGAGWGALARATAQWLLGRPALYGIPSSLPSLRLGETVYREPWRPSGLPSASAGLLSVTLSLVNREARIRRQHARVLEGYLRGRGAMTLVRLPDRARPGYLRLAVLTPWEDTQAAASDRARRLGVMPGYPKPLHRLAQFSNLCLNRGSRFSGAGLLSKRLITLPTHSLLSSRDLRAIQSWIG